MKTTLNAIRAYDLYADGWRKLLRHLGKKVADDEPLSIRTILESNGLDDAIWCLRAVEGHDGEIRLFAVDCARDVQYLMKDARSVRALDVAERYAKGDATEEELRAARDDAAGAWSFCARASDDWDDTWSARAAWTTTLSTRAATCAATWDASIFAAGGTDIREEQLSRFLAMLDRAEGAQA